MKKLFSIFAFLSLAVGFTACEEVSSDIDNPGDNTKDPVVVLTSNKQEFVADGKDCVTFTVTVDGVSKIDGVQIICLNDNQVLETTVFSTTTAGEYRFVAAYNNTFTSETITIVAKSASNNDSGDSDDQENQDGNEDDGNKDDGNEDGGNEDDDKQDGNNDEEDPDYTITEVVLTADKTEILADNLDVVTFTVTVDGEDKSAEAKIFLLNDNSELAENAFTTDAAGEYVFEAVYGDVKSNQVVVNAKYAGPKSLVLKASKLRIKADGTDSTTFTVLYGEEDVTAECEFKAVEGQTIEGSVFTTTEIGTYNVYALYDNVRSNTVSVDAYDPNIVSPYEIGQIYEIGGNKGVAYAIKTDNNGITWAYFFSMDEADLQWSTENVMCNCISPKGALNTYDPFDPTYSRADGGVRDIDNYPAFKWCMEHGEDWFLPSSTELQWMWDAISGGTHNFDSDSVKAYNKLLTDNGGMPFISTYYWSSNESNDSEIELIAFMSDSVVCLEPLKSKSYTARAAYRIQLN